MIIIDPTHNGPPGSGHGGVAAGRFAELVDPHRARVRFHAFIPLAKPLTGQPADDGAVAVSDGDTLIATVAPTDPFAPFADLPVPELDDVAAAEARWYAAYRDRHPFPTCFGCGPARPERDGLHLRPGALAGLDVHATTWRPTLDGPTPAWLVWAALDCGSAGPALAGMPDGASVVTGELSRRHPQHGARRRHGGDRQPRHQPQRPKDQGRRRAHRPPHRPAPRRRHLHLVHHRPGADTMTLRRPDPRPNRALIFTPMEQRRHLIVDAAVLADQLGYHTVLVPEGWGFDAGVVLAEIALKTTRIRIATGITSIWGRSPATLAMMAATLDDLSGGRFTLGLGTSTPTLAEQFHDVAFHRPAARLAHTLSQVRTLLHGERITPTGGGRGLRLGVPARPDLPIWVAALGPRATATAVRAADGWYPALVPRDRIDTLRSSAATAARGIPP